MRILYIGDVVGSFGVRVLKSKLNELKNDQKIDLIVAQSENVTNGKGISAADFKYLKDLGVDFFTGGNHSFVESSINVYLDNPSEPIIGPANYDHRSKTIGVKELQTKYGKILFVSLLGQIVGKDSGLLTVNPLKLIDQILEERKQIDYFAKIVNIHGDFSSEKVVMGHYLDGRVSAVIGDHWHVPTADARLLSSKTAYISDVGMTGALDSSLGVKYEVIIARWRDNLKNRHILEDSGSWQLNGVIVEIDNQSKKPVLIEGLNLRGENL